MKALHIMDTKLNLLGEMTQYTSLRIKRLFSGVGDFQLELPMHHPMSKKLSRDRILYPVGFPERAVIIEDMAQEEGKDKLIVKGYPLSGVLKRRICVPPTAASAASYGYDRVTGDAETVMKHYIRNNVTEPESEARRIGCIELEANAHRGRSDVAWSARFEDLDAVLTQIGAYTDAGFDIVPDFEKNRLVARFLPGRDLTGADGLHRVTFAAGMGNVLSATYSESARRHRNAAVVAGAGEDENRLILLHGTAADLERRETYIDGGSESDPAQLRFKAEHMLADKPLEQTIRAQVKETAACRYGVHWDLGDKVNVIHGKRMMRTRIAQVQESHEPGKEMKITVAFGDPPAGIERVIAERTRTIVR